jgi:hypothetical protein
MNFVQNGGGLMMVCDHTVSDRNNDGWDSPMVWNDLINNNGIQADPFGIKFDLVNISQTTSNIPSLPGDPLLHGIMGDVTQAKWSNGTTMTLTPSNNSTVKGVVYQLYSGFGNTNVMCAYSSYGSGKVVGIGDSSPCDDGTGDSGDGLYNGWTGDASGNHERLLMNATIWLATSSAALPTVTTLAATGVTLTGATLNGTVNPNGVSTTWHFDWGTTSSYGSSTTATSAGSGSVAISENLPLTGLNPATTYHFRMAADNTGGSATGTDFSFTTLMPTLSITPANQNVTVSAGSTAFTITSNSSWTASSNQSWCTVPASGNGNGMLTATFTANTSVIQRVATITVTVSGITPVTVTVTQAAATPTLSVTPSNQSVTYPAGSTSFTITSNTSWTVSSDQTWCTVASSGSGNSTLTANYTANTLITQRIANITVTVSGISPVTVTVAQAEAPPSLSVSPSNQSVSYTLGATAYSITSNTTWNASSDQSWCTVPSSGSGNGTLTANYGVNTAVIQRIANIIVTVAGISPVMVTLTQAGAPPTLSVSPSSQSVPYSAGNTSFGVTSNTTWTASCDQSWCLPTASGTGDGTLFADVTQNTLNTERSATITITPDGGSPSTVTVVQAASLLGAEPTDAPTDFTPYNIIVQWSDATGTVAPQGYLVRMSSTGFSAISNPVDGIPITDSFSDKNVSAGVQEAWFKNLAPGTVYYFKIFSYNGSGTGINYKTDGDIQQLKFSTLP